MRLSNLYQGESVFKVTAIDQDTGVNDDMVYSIEGELEQLVLDEFTFIYFLLDKVRL